MQNFSDKTFEDPHRREGDPIIEDDDMEDVMARMRANRRTDEHLQQEEHERDDRKQCEHDEREQREGRYAKLDCGEVRTHITAGEVEEILKALADRIDAAHSRPVTEGRPEGIERAYAAYGKLYT